MKYIVPLVLGLTLILGLVAWRTRERTGETLPTAPQSARGPDPAVAPASPHEELALGHVGSQRITANRLSRWKSIDEVRSGKASPDGDVVGFLELTLKREIAERVYGLRPSAADLEAMLRKMAADPEEAALLARIEVLFHGDRRAFLEEVIAPAFIESELWARFRDDPGIHAAARASAEGIAARARQSPQDFQTIGSTDASFGRGLLPLSPDVTPPKWNPLPRLDTLLVDRATLARLPAGQPYPDVLATPDAFVVLQVDRQKPGFTEVQTWTVPKPAYQTWLIDRARDVDRTIDSPELQAQVEALDSNHWLSRAFRP